MQLLREMVERGQVEMFGGGDMEPVLAVDSGARSHRPGRPRCPIGWRSWAQPAARRLAHRARVGSDRGPGAGRRRHPATSPWTTTTSCAPASSAEELTGYFTTEEDGTTASICFRSPRRCATAFRLRRRTRPSTIIERAGRSIGGSAAAIYFDDIEKFGIWPETYNWVYESKWLEQFIEGVLASAAIATAHFSDYRSAAPHARRGLPADHFVHRDERMDAAGRRAPMRYADLVKQEKDHDRYERDKAFLRGGIWKNFLSRYAESNWMHKRMLAAVQPRGVAAAAASATAS